MTSTTAARRKRDLDTEEGRADLSSELADVLASQAGDQRATMALVDRYRPLVYSTVGRVTLARGLNKMDAEDLASDLIVVVLETLRDFDASAGHGLGGILKQRFAGVVSDLSTVIDVPRSTLARYWAAMQRADGDVNRAAALAPAMGPGKNLSVELFWEVHQALRVGAPEVAEEAPWGPDQRPAPTLERYEQAREALSVLTDAERAVIDIAYGFVGDGAAHSDAWVASELGKSESTVRNARARALAKMRAHLGAGAVLA